MYLGVIRSILSKRRIVYFLVLFLCAIITCDIFLTIFSIWLLFGLILFLQIVLCNRFENAFFLIPFSGIIAGAIFISQGIYGIGGYFIFLGLLLIWKDIYRQRNILIKGYAPLFLIFVLFGFSAFLNESGDYYSTKLLNTYINGTSAYIAFSVLFIYRSSIRLSLLALIFILWGIFLLRFVIDINNIPGPGNFFHFGFMREQTNIFGLYAIINEGDFTISYHLPGFLSLIGLSLFLIDSKNNGFIVVLGTWFLSFLVIYYSGARQNLLAYLVMIIYIIITLKDYSIIFKFFAVVIIGIISVLTLSSINSDVIQEILYSGKLSGAIHASGRSELVSRGFELFNINPLWGIGFGHFNYDGTFGNYPHNIIVELLAEIGIIGTIFIIVLCGYSMYKSHTLILSISNNSYKTYLIMLPPFVRALVSLDMSQNIILFSLIFSFNCISLKLKETEN